MSESEGHVLVDAVEETCVLVGIITSAVTDEQAHEYLDELEFLAETAGATSIKRFTQKLPMANPRTFVGTGKLEEIKEYVKENGVELVIFDDEPLVDTACGIAQQNLLAIVAFAEIAAGKEVNAGDLELRCGHRSGITRLSVAR